MTATTALPRVATMLTGGAAGTVTAFVPGEDDSTARDLARKAAQKAAHTPLIGRTPPARRATLDGFRGHAWTFSPVTVVRASDGTVRAPEQEEEAPEQAPELDLSTLSRKQLLALLTAQTAPAPAPVKGKAGKGKAKANTFVRDVIAPRAAKRAAAKCKRCADYGIVPGRGPKFDAGKPFRSGNGASTSPTAIPCPACKGKSHAALDAWQSEQASA